MKIDQLPQTCGVYLMRDSAANIIYIGKAKNLKKRVSQYFSRNSGDGKTLNLVSMTRQIDYIQTQSEREALLLERQLINKYQPFFNILWKDSKSYPYLKITKNEDFPRIFFTRRKEKDGALYFGPYPKVENLRKLLNYLEKINYINLRKCKWRFGENAPLPEKKIKSCIYYHTSKCPAPCASKIGKHKYNALVKRVIMFLRGDFSNLLQALKKEMQAYSKNLEYEKAAEHLCFIKAIEHLSEKVQVFEMDFKDVERAILKNRQLSELKEILKLRHVPVHIESFDVSSLFARYSVGSSVCFKNAEKNPSHFRRYKIKLKSGKSGSDDPAMINEIVKRRIKAMLKTGEGFPDLILIDGGRTQLRAASSALRELRVKIPIISLAKKNEEIYTPKSSKPIVLRKDSDALKFVQRVRDEAHKFAITYHKKLRNNSLHLSETKTNTRKTKRQD